MGLRDVDASNYGLLVARVNRYSGLFLLTLLCFGLLTPVLVGEEQGRVNTGRVNVTIEELAGFLRQTH